MKNILKFSFTTILLVLFAYSRRKEVTAVQTIPGATTLKIEKLQLKFGFITPTDMQIVLKPI